MNTSDVSLIATLVASLMAAFAAYLAAYAKAKGLNQATEEDFAAALERTRATTAATEGVRSSLAARDTAGTELRTALRGYAAASASLVHSMCWLSWNARARGRLDATLAKQYDQDAHTCSPQIIANMAVIASLSPETHDRLAQYTEKLFRQDAAIGDAIVACETDVATGLGLLTACHQPSVDLELELRTIIKGLGRPATATN